MKNFLIALAICCLTQTANALDFSAQLIDSEGVPICSEEVRDGKTCPENKVFTLGRVIKLALYQSYPDEAAITGDEKYKRAELAQSITGVTDLKLKIEDKALIKKLVGKLFTPLIVYTVWKMLED